MATTRKIVLLPSKRASGSEAHKSGLIGHSPSPEPQSQGGHGRGHGRSRSSSGGRFADFVNTAKLANSARPHESTTTKISPPPSPLRTSAPLSSSWSTPKRGLIPVGVAIDPTDPGLQTPPRDGWSLRRSGTGYSSLSESLGAVPAAVDESLSAASPGELADGVAEASLGDAAEPPGDVFAGDSDPGDDPEALPELDDDDTLFEMELADDLAKSWPQNSDIAEQFADFDDARVQIRAGGSPENSRKAHRAFLRQPDRLLEVR